jgi:hypothetical protein
LRVNSLLEGIRLNYRKGSADFEWFIKRWRPTTYTRIRQTRHFDTMTMPEISPLYLAQFGLQREPPRPVGHREPGYENEYDSDTLFFDVFMSDDGTEIVAPCPATLSCEEAINRGIFRLSEIGPALDFRYSGNELVGCFRFTVPEGSVAVISGST